MARNHNDQNAVRQYLLRQLSDDEQQIIEQRLLTEDDLFEELEIAEDELIDGYVAEQLSDDDRRKFEQNFLVAPERKQKLRFAEALKRNMMATPISDAEVIRPSWFFLLIRWLRQSFFTSPLLVAASFLIVASLGFAVWRGYFYQSDVDKGLVALNAAYREQRPIEARITQLDYAPFVTTRGPGTSKINESELRRAELTLLDALNKNPTPAVHHALGKVYLAKDDFDRAIEQFEEALKGNPNDAQIYADLGAAYLEKGKIEIDKAGSDEKSAGGGKGLEILGHALENLNRALDLNPNLHEALFNRALCKQSMTLYAQAEADWRQYLQKDPNSPWAKEARQNLKSLENRRARAAESEQQLQQQFLQAFEVQNDDAAWAALSRTQRRAGNSIVEKLLDDYLNFSILGQSEDARRALRLMVYAGDVEMKRAGERYTSDLAKLYSEGGLQRWKLLAAARNQMKLATASFNRNEFDNAIQLFSLAADVFMKSADLPEALFARSWVGYSTIRISRAEEGVRIFEELSIKFEERGYKFFHAWALTALGDAHSSANEFSKTLEYANRGLDASEQVEDTANAMRCLSQRVSMYLMLNNEDRSLDSFLRATILAEDVPPDPKLLWPFYYEAALNFHFLNLPSSALAFAQEAMALANAADVPLLRSRSWERLGIIYGQQRNFSAAIECGSHAVAEAQHIAGELSRKNIAAHSTLILGELYASSGDANKGIQYFDESIRLYENLDLDVYSYRAHKGKLLSLISLHDPSAGAELETVLRLFESQRQKITEESNRDKFFDSGQDTYDVAIEFALSGNKDYEKAFEYAEASRARSLFEMMGSGIHPVTGRDGRDLSLGSETKPLTADEIQKQMPANAQVLEYAVLNDKIVMWVVTPSAIRGAELPADAQKLEQSVRRYVSLLSGGNNQPVVAGQIRSEGQKLHQNLIAPIEGLLDTKIQLCIVPDKSLNYLPFAALLAPSDKYLIEDFELEQSPSAGVFVRSSAIAAQKARSRTETLLSVGNPDFDRSQFGSLKDLPAAANEASEIASFYKPATVLTGAPASRDRVIRGFAKADVVHFATHAVADEDSPLESRLILARDNNPLAGSIESDGAFDVFDIYALQAPRARLVVLSACQTGIEQSYKGEGAIGLARPFIAVGVPLVVASLWPVESNSAADLMISFHRYRKLNQLPTVSALRMAQLDAIHHQSPHSENGYGWAAFTAIGGYAVY